MKSKFVKGEPGVKRWLLTVLLGIGLLMAGTVAVTMLVYTGTWKTESIGYGTAATVLVSSLCTSAVAIGGRGEGRLTAAAISAGILELTVLVLSFCFSCVTLKGLLMNGLLIAAGCAVPILLANPTKRKKKFLSAKRWNG